MTDGRLFEFDEIDANLDLVPLGVRRLLDHLGAKLSLEGWRSLSLPDRKSLLSLGSAAFIDEAGARLVLQHATPSPRAIDPTGDPRTDEVPSRVVAMLGAGKPLSVPLWCSLEPLERWVLDKVSQSGNAERLPLAYDEIVNAARRLTHLNSAGEARMVGTEGKPVTTRRAVASSLVTMSADAHRCLVEGNAKKGDVLGTARLAGIMAAKQTSHIIPLCHPVRLTRVDVSIVPSAAEYSVELRAEVTAVDRTGVEMEAMVAVSVAALTIYDMLKAIDRSIVIGPIRLMEKTGGKSGEYRA